MTTDHTMKESNSRGDDCSSAFSELIRIMAELRGPGGCPWDKQQTHETLQPYLIEETYEVLDSIDRKAYGELRKELGDLLLQVVFHAQLASEESLFTITDVIREINAKLIHRHPHVFGDVKIQTTDQVNEQWERLKFSEKRRQTGLLGGVPENQPALNRAYRVQEKAAAVGFDWPDTTPVWDKIAEELEELKQEIKTGDREHAEKEFGDVLFSLVNLGRKLRLNAEDSLRRTVSVFIQRFRFIEEKLEDQGKTLTSATLEEMDDLWNRAKAEQL